MSCGVTLAPHEQQIVPRNYRDHCRSARSGTGRAGSGTKVTSQFSPCSLGCFGRASFPALAELSFLGQHINQARGSELAIDARRVAARAFPAHVVCVLLAVEWGFFFGMTITLIHGKFRTLSLGPLHTDTLSDR
jgi:hypothetical protein